MLGFVAAVLFAIAFLINATSTSTSAVFSPTSLMLVGLTLLALHLSRRWHEMVRARAPEAPVTLIKT